MSSWPVRDPVSKARWKTPEEQHLIPATMCTCVWKYSPDTCARTHIYMNVHPIHKYTHTRCVHVYGSVHSIYMCTYMHNTCMNAHPTHKYTYKCTYTCEHTYSQTIHTVHVNICTLMSTHSFIPFVGTTHSVQCPLFISFGHMIISSVGLEPHYSNCDLIT